MSWNDTLTPADLERESGLAPARGCLVGLALAAPFWAALVAIVAYLLR